LVGIRDDQDNHFRFPVEEHLNKRLQDVLENSVDEKYFLSEKILKSLTFETKGNYEVANTNNGQKGIVQSENGEAISCLTASDYKQPKQILIQSSTVKGYEEATEGDSISLAHPGSETRRGRVGHQVSQTLDTGCQQGVLVGDFRSDEGFRWLKDGNSPTIMTENNALIIQDNFKIRKLTPRECFRLMDFPDTFTWTVSDSQAYKQAGNSIVVNVLYKILKNLIK